MDAILRRVRLSVIFKRLALVAIGLFIGAIVGAACTYTLMLRANHKWVELTKEHHGLAYSNEVFVEADIPLPDVKDPNGQAKFVDRVASGKERNWASS